MAKRKQTSDEELMPWERQPDESDAAWSAFRAYREMSRRSLRDLASSISQQQNRNEATTFRQLGEWSGKWKWRARVEAWDRYLDLEAQAEVRKRHREALRGAGQVLAEPIRVYLEALRREPLLAQRLAEELLEQVARGRGHGLGAFAGLQAMMARSGVALAQLATAERLAHGMATERIAAASSEQEQADGSGGALDRAAEADPETAALVRSLLRRASGRADEPGGAGLGGDAG